MKEIAVFCATGVAVALSACGALDADTSSAPALAVLQGNLTNPSSLGISSSSAVHVAVVWKTNGGRFNVAEDLPVQALFPSSFTIALDGPPPEEAMNAEVEQSPPPPSGPSTGGPPTATNTGVPSDAGPLDTDAAASASLVLLDQPVTTDVPSRVALGTVVAYLDQNHNGKLDLVAEDATAYVDQIVAANPDMSIVYFEGPILLNSSFGVGGEDSAGHRPVDGYNLLRLPACNEPPVSFSAQSFCPTAASPPAAGPCPSFEWLGVKTQFPLAITSSPAVGRLMCQANEQPGPGATAVATGMGGPFDPAVQPAEYPAAMDPNLCCLPDGSDYLYFTCMQISQGLCKGTIESCTSVGYARPTPVPQDWPCAH